MYKYLWLDLIEWISFPRCKNLRRSCFPSSQFNSIYLNTLILAKVTSNSRLPSPFYFFLLPSCQTFPLLTSCGAVYYPTDGARYRNVEISSTPGLATRGASLFVLANGKGVCSRNSYFSRCPMFSTTMSGQIKFSQFPREIEPPCARKWRSRRGSLHRAMHVHRKKVDPR